MIYAGARLALLRLPRRRAALTAFLVLVWTFLVNDRGDTGNPPLPGLAGATYVAFEILSALPIPSVALLFELVAV